MSIAAVADNDMLRTLDEFNFHQLLAASRGTAIVFFTRRGCSSCQRWKRLLNEFASQSSVAVFMIDAEENMALTHEFDLFHMPALFLYLDGEFHCELQVEARLELIQPAIEKALQQPAHEAP